MTIWHAIAYALFWSAIGALSTASVYEVRRMKQAEQERPIVRTRPLRRWARRGPVPPPVAPVTALRAPQGFLRGTGDADDIRKGA